ncbi:MAG: HDIG domain-containing protein [Deltaproteobacteria bacterium]|nr:HDIG domain-containing protein [Deltaproteobacteria bacterium]
MSGAQSRPFFSRFWLPSLLSLLVAAALATIAVFDVLVYPLASWRAGDPAPISQRHPTMHQTAEQKLLTILDADTKTESRFIVRRGEIVQPGQLKLLRRLQPERLVLDPVRATGLWAFFFLALSFFIAVLRRSGQQLQLRFRAAGSVLLVLVLSVAATRALLDYSNLSLFAAPISLAVLAFAPLLGPTLAFALHLLAVALVLPLLGTSPGTILVPLAAGWTSVLLLKSGSGAVRKLLAALAGAVGGLVCMAMLGLFSPDRFDYGLHLESDGIGLLGASVASGLLAALLHYPLTLMFGCVPRSKLSALADLEHPLLKDLSEKAPGTFQHTLAVANMSEKVAQDIGADAHLARVGAYYHDIGKMHGPEFFVENQQGDNPHDKLEPGASVEKLRGHVEHGVTIARGADLPERIIDFIIEHHGSSSIEFFLHKARQLTGQEPDPRQYQYRGRNPTSRETAVLMIADSVEAASRTLKSPDHEQVEHLVRTIMFGKLLKGYLDESGLSSRDLKQMGQSLVRYLEAQLHVRIEYPWQRQAAGEPPPQERPSGLIRPGRIVQAIDSIPPMQPEEPPAERNADGHGQEEG